MYDGTLSRRDREVLRSDPSYSILNQPMRWRIFQDFKLDLVTEEANLLP
jgi:hypothetical protein